MFVLHKGDSNILSHESIIWTASTCCCPFIARPVPTHAIIIRNESLTKSASDNCGKHHVVISARLHSVPFLRKALRLPICSYSEKVPWYLLGIHPILWIDICTKHRVCR